MEKNPRARGRLRRQSARLRKKKHVGEFQELVFQVKAVFTHPLTLAELDRFIDDVITYVESQALCIGAFGGGENVTETEGWVEAWKRGSVTEEQREHMLAWLEARPEVTRAVAGPLFDGWYDYATQPALVCKAV
jgi:uncharacterized protein YggL (DUF469 family)